MLTRWTRVFELIDSFEGFNLVRTGLALGVVAVTTDVIMTMVKRHLQQRALFNLIQSPKVLLFGCTSKRRNQRLLERPDALAIVDKVSTADRNSCSLIISRRGCGVSTLLKTVAATRRGVVYTSLEGVASTAQLTAVLAMALGLKYSVKLPAWLVAVQRIVSGESHSVETYGDDAFGGDAGAAWYHVTTHFEDAAAAGAAAGSRPLLIFDHANELTAEAASALNAWILSLMSVGNANVFIVSDRPFALFNTSVTPRTTVIRIPTPSFDALKGYLMQRCPALSDGAANYIIAELTGVSISMLELAIEFILDNGPNMALLHDVIIERSATVTRPWHTGCSQPTGMADFDEMRYVIFTLCVNLLEKCPPKVLPLPGTTAVYELSTEEAARRFANAPRLNFHQAFQLVKYSVYRRLVETPNTAVTLPIWTSFDEVAFQWPGMRLMLEWVFGEVGSPRYQQTTFHLAALLEQPN